MVATACDCRLAAQKFAINETATIYAIGVSETEFGAGVEADPAVHSRTDKKLKPSETA
jgi:hypothetical protein